MNVKYRIEAPDGTFVQSMSEFTDGQSEKTLEFSTMSEAISYKSMNPHWKDYKVLPFESD